MSQENCSHTVEFSSYCHLCEDEYEAYVEQRKQHMKFCIENELVYEVNFEDQQRADYMQRKEIARWKRVTGFDDPESLRMYLSGQTIHQADDESSRIFSKVSRENNDLKKQLLELAEKFEGSK